jgi:hypothetical protein
MKKSHKYLSFVLGLIISFPILFQSFHAIDHHILVDDISCCLHQDAAQSDSYNLIFDGEIDLCPILEYQIVYFLSGSQVLPEHKITLVDDLKTTIFGHPIVKLGNSEILLRGPPLV